MNPNAEGGKTRDDEDEEDGHAQGGQRVQCNQQWETLLEGIKFF